MQVNPGPQAPIPASDAAIAHARDILNRANETDDDPRRTRIDFLQVANYIAARSACNPELHEVVGVIEEFVRNQIVSAEAIDAAAKNGWPVIPAIPGPLSHFHAAMRLAADATLRNRRFIDTFEESINDIGAFRKRVTKALASSEPDLCSAITVVASEMAASSVDFRRRIIAASKDIQQILTGGELPRPADFDGPLPPEAEWPPLRLGCPPILGGLFKQDPTDYTPSEGGGTYSNPLPGSSVCAGVTSCIIVGVVVVAVLVFALVTGK